MTTETTQVYRVYIKATPEAVWEAITQPDWTEQYLYQTRVDYDMRPGGEYRGFPSELMRTTSAEMGYPVPDVVVDGEVLEVDPPKKLVQTWRLLMDPEAAAQGFTRLTWELEAIGSDVTKLTVVHELEGAPKLQLLVGGKLEHEGAGGGWAMVLSALKTLLETGQALQA